MAMERIDIKLKAFGLSFLLHAFLLLFLLFLTNRPMERKEAIEIDLSLDSFKVEKLLEKEKAIKQEKNIKSYEAVPVRRESDQPHIIKSIKEEASLPPLQTQEVSQPISQKNEEMIGQNTSQKSHDQAVGSKGKGEEAVALGDVKRESKESLNKEHAQEMFLKEKLSVISSIVQRNISYPPLARKMGWEGKVVIYIHLRSDGTLEDVKIEKSSGYELLDRNALETVKRVAHLFPKPPVDVVIRLPVSYKLE